MYKNVKCFSCHAVEAVEYFKSLGMSYGDTSAVS